MSPMILIGRSAMIDAGRIVAVIPARSAPVRRWLADVTPTRVLNLTYGYPRRSIILFDNGTLAITSLSITDLAKHLDGLMEVLHADPD